MDAPFALTRLQTALAAAAVVDAAVMVVDVAAMEEEVAVTSVEEVEVRSKQPSHSRSQLTVSGYGGGRGGKHLMLIT